MDIRGRLATAWCAERTPSRKSTWINAQILRLYRDLHERGFAHSVECWQDDQLVGGLYGVALGGAFFGESMFSRESDASKVALVHLVARLRYTGFILLDTQFVTEHLSQFGTKEIPRMAYRAQLARALKITPDFAGPAEAEVIQTYLQSITQTS